MRSWWPKSRRPAADADDLTPPKAPTAAKDARLVAAEAGWGTTLRYGLLRLVDRLHLIIGIGIGGAAAPAVTQLLMSLLDAKGYVR